jgi:hypothetical protein
MPFIQVKEMNSTALQALTSRRQNILDNIRDNDEAGAGYRKVFSSVSFYLVAI